MTKITKIEIAPTDFWRKLGPENPLRATVRLEADGATLETTLNDSDCSELLDIVQRIISRAGKRNTEQVVANVSMAYVQTIEEKTK